MKKSQAINIWRRGIIRSNGSIVLKTVKKLQYDPVRHLNLTQTIIARISAYYRTLCYNQFITLLYPTWRKTLWPQISRLSCLELCIFCWQNVRILISKRHCSLNKSLCLTFIDCIKNLLVCSGYFNALSIICCSFEILTYGWT